MRMQTRKNYLIWGAVLIIFLWTFPVGAEDSSTDSSKAQAETGSLNESAAMEPKQLGKGFLALGFRWVNGDNFSRAGEYEDDQSSPTLDLGLEIFPLPHRYFLNGDFRTSHDFYGDIGYAYKDIFLLRNVLVGLHHNLDHYDYLHPGEPPQVTYEDRNPSDTYFVDFLKNDLYLRLKAPEYPFHAFLNHRYVERDGSLQERFLIGYFGGLNKTAETRDIDWKSNTFSLGANSHLGPVEVEYAHHRFAFDPGAHSELYDYFAAGRPPDIYPHNVVPETEAYGNSLKLHSSYTGQIVASASLRNEESTNNYSGAESSVWRGSFNLQWIPDPVISMFFRYRHLQTDRDNPERMTLNGLLSSVSYEVRTPISTRKDLFTLSARYRPISKLTLQGNYEYEMRKRKNVDEWLVLPEDSDIHRISLTARARLINSLKLKAVYAYQYFADPAYNIEPDHSNKLRLNAAYTPTDWMTASLDYTISMTSRDNLIYLNGSSLVDDGERDGRSDQIMGNMSFILSPSTSLTASYAYNKWNVEHDTAYSMWNAAGTSTTAVPYYNVDAPYTDDAHTFALTVFTRLRKDIGLKAGLSYTLAESEYRPSPSYLTVFTSRESTETIARLELTQKLQQDWEVGVQFKAGFYSDDYTNAALDRQDDEIYVTTLTLKRYF